MTTRKPLVMVSGALKELASGDTIPDAAIANGAVTYARLQDISATSRVLGRKTSGAGDPEELTLSEVLDFIGSAAQGDILYRGTSAWARLAAGTSGQFLKTQGAGANPVWDTPAGGGGGAVTLISEVVTSGSQADVTFSSISSSYRDLQVRIRGRGTNATTDVNVLLQFNSDTGANYDYTVWHVFGTGAGASQTYTSTSAFLARLSAGSAPADVASSAVIDVLDYRGTTFQKSMQSRWNSKLSNSATFSLGSGAYAAWWRSTAAINAIKVFLSAGNFQDGSVVSLYGVT